MEVRLIDDARHTWLSNNQLTAQVSFFLCDPLRYILKRRMQWCGSRTPSGCESVRYALTMPCPSLSVHHINTILYLSFLFSDLVHIDHIFLFYFFLLMPSFIFCITCLHFGHEWEQMFHNIFVSIASNFLVTIF